MLHVASQQLVAQQLTDLMHRPAKILHSLRVVQGYQQGAVRHIAHARMAVASRCQLRT